MNNYKSYWDDIPIEVIDIIKEYTRHPIIDVIDECVQWMENVLSKDSALLRSVHGDDGPRSLSYYLDDVDDDIASDEYMCTIAPFVRNNHPLRGGRERRPTNLLCGADAGLCEIYKFRETKYTKFRLRRLLYRSLYNTDILISKKERVTQAHRRRRKRRRESEKNYYVYYDDDRLLNLVRQEREIKYMINHYWSIQKWSCSIRR